MKRFAHTQASGKVRPVDDGRSSGHNDLASATETIYNHSPDLVVAAAKQLLAVLHVEFECLPDWAALAFGTCDMASAYRQLPNCPEEAPGTVIAFWHPQCQGVRYTILHAHPFGLAAAVLNFNRVPALATAVSRRCLACAVTHYFDDSGIMDWATARGSAQECVESVYGVFGMTLDPHKQQPMASQRVFLGVLLDFSSFVHQSIMRVDVKPGLRDALSEEIGAILDQNSCTAAQAAKLRGRFSRAASAMFGKCARGGQAPLSQQQHHPRPGKLSPELQEALFFMRALAQYIPAREIDLRAQFSAVAVMYTDGSWEPAEMNAPGLGFVLTTPELSATELFSQRLQLGLAAFTGFLLVLACALMVKVLSCLYRRQEYDSVDGRTADNQVVDEQERATILADVYGKPEDADEMDIGDEAALERAWQAIEQAASSDEDLCEADLKQGEQDVGGQLSKSTLKAIRGLSSKAQTAAEVFDISPVAENANPSFFDIGDAADAEDSGHPFFEGASESRSRGSRANGQQASSSDNILEL
ncbi:unnamed protein product [Effrenium voratum]|nr:unnamed protein product [Effrenium voratum]